MLNRTLRCSADFDKVGRSMMFGQILVRFGTRTNHVFLHQVT